MSAEQRAVLHLLALRGAQLRELRDLRWRDVDSGEGKRAAALAVIRPQNASPDGYVFATSTGGRAGAQVLRNAIWKHERATYVSSAVAAGIPDVHVLNHLNGGWLDDLSSEDRRRARETVDRLAGPVGSVQRLNGTAAKKTYAAVERYNRAVEAAVRAADRAALSQNPGLELEAIQAEIEQLRALDIARRAQRESGLLLLYSGRGDDARDAARIEQLLRRADEIRRMRVGRRLSGEPIPGERRRRPMTTERYGKALSADERREWELESGADLPKEDAPGGDALGHRPLSIRWGLVDDPPDGDDGAAPCRLPSRGASHGNPTLKAVQDRCGHWPERSYRTRANLISRAARNGIRLTDTQAGRLLDDDDPVAGPLRARYGRPSRILDRMAAAAQRRAWTLLSLARELDTAVSAARSVRTRISQPNAPPRSGRWSPPSRSTAAGRRYDVSAVTLRVMESERLVNELARRQAEASRPASHDSSARDR